MIFLDVRQDSYFAIATDSHHSWKPVFDGAIPLQAAPDLLALLRSRGALKSQLPDLSYLAPVDVKLPCDSVLERGYDRATITVSGLRKVAAAFIWSSLSLKLYGLERTLLGLQRRRQHSTSDPDRAVHAAVTFHACRRIVPIQPVCLIDSVSMAAYLRSEKISAELIFGVQDDPFRAHCWVQTEDILLNDSVHRVRSFVAVRRN